MLKLFVYSLKFVQAAYRCSDLCTATSVPLYNGVHVLCKHKQVVGIDDMVVVLEPHIAPHNSHPAPLPALAHSLLHKVNAL